MTEVENHTDIEQDRDGTWRVSTTNNGWQWWGIAVTFPTKAAAESVAEAIERALVDGAE